MRIAVCDDDLRELREIMSLIEEYPRKAAYGISATAFSNSEELAERIGEFDVFLLDYRMPDIDGFELARRIREEYMTTKTIIFISQYDDIVYDAFEVHAHRYLTQSPLRKRSSTVRSTSWTRTHIHSAACSSETAGIQSSST